MDIELAAGRRYLVPFHPKSVPHVFTDVLIIGGGLAGLRAALELPPSIRAYVATKDQVRESSSAYAQGGIAGVLDPEDRFEDHIADTLAAGKGLCDPAIVEVVVREGPERIRELVAWGTDFDRDGGTLALTREGGHSHARIVHAHGDSTGAEVMRAVIQRARGAANLRIWENSFTVDLLTWEGRCRGAVIDRPAQGIVCVWAKATILASGGAGQLYRETTNSAVATADGLAIAFRGGAELRDLEMMQFHPTVLYIPGSARYLMTEAIRGEGAYLRDQTGHRFMPDYDPRAELAPRDVVALAITQQMAKTQHPCVYLDLRHLDPAHVRSRFPMIDQVCHHFGLNLTTDLIPVRPGAHYMVGGVTIDPQGRTTLAGLWACGEVASSGLHGANRLGSNSLLECLVFGARCGRGAAAEAGAIADRYTALPIVSQAPPGPEDEMLDVEDIRASLKSLMWRNVGIMRTAGGLDEAARMVDFWRTYVLSKTFTTAAGWELQNMLTVARLMIAAASARTETRGVHNRGDFPQTDDPAWKQHITIRHPAPA